MNEDIYEQSADMRLLDLQRKAIGAEQRVFKGTFIPEADLVSVKRKPVIDDAPRGVILSASLDAQPRSGIIAGALITVSIAITNEGDEPAVDVHVELPLPAATEYRPQTAQLDGQAAPDTVASDLLSDGYTFAEIAPGTRRTIVLKLLAQAATSDITFSPHLRSASGAVLGMRAIRLARSVPRPSVRLAPSQPFYELDDDEAPASVAPILPVRQPAELPPSPPAPAARRKAVRAKPKARVKANVISETLEAVAAPAPRLVAEPTVSTPAAVVVGPRAKIVSVVTIVATGGPLLTVRVDAKRIATLESLFAGPSLGMIAHYLLLNALAARTALPGDADTSAIGTFVSAQETLLSRALIATRLGKVPPADSLAAALPAFPPAVRNRTGTHTVRCESNDLLLVRVFEPNDMVFLGRMLENTSALPFLRAAQLFVGLCPTDIALADPKRRTELVEALHTYRVMATTEISRIFLRAKMTRSPAIFKDTDRVFDTAARTVLALLAGRGA